MEKDKSKQFYEAAKKDLLYIFDKYVRVYFNKDVTVEVIPVYEELEDVVLLDEISLKEFKVYPCVNNPVMCLHLMNVSINKEKKKAVREILDEIFIVSEYGYNSDDIYLKYDCSKPKHKKSDIETVNSKKLFDRSLLHKKNRYEFAYELGIANWIGNASGKVMYDVIDEIAKWGVRTYEGQKVPYGVLIDLKDDVSNGNINFVEFLRNEKSGAVFTDGINSFVKINALGEVIKYFSVDVKEPKLKSFTPTTFEKFANMCISNDDVNNIGIVLMKNGTILIVKKQKLILARRNGRWDFVDCEYINDKLFHFIERDRQIKDKSDIAQLSQTLLLSILDVSFIGHGGCIAIVKDKHLDCVRDNYCNNDRLDKESNTRKHIFIKQLIEHPNTLKFQELDRNLLLDFLSLDGALVIDTKGNLISIGAIVKVPGGSNEGGRTAATKELARYGMGIKISEDGKISMYKQDIEPCNPVKRFFESE